MVMESKYGLMEPNTKDSGKITKLKEKELFGMQREMFMTESSKMTKLTDMEFTRMSMAHGMKVIGKMICKKVMVKKYGVTAPSTLVTIKKVKNITMVFTNGLMVLSTRETGMKIK